VSDVPDLSLLLQSWQLTLRAERKSAQTIKSYVGGARSSPTRCSG